MPRFLAARAVSPSLRHVVVAGQATGGAMGWDDLLAREAPPSRPRPPGPRTSCTGATRRAPPAAEGRRTHPQGLRGRRRPGRRRALRPRPRRPGLLRVQDLLRLRPRQHALLSGARGRRRVLVAERLDAERALGDHRRRAAHRLLRGADAVRAHAEVRDAERRFDLSSLRLCVSSGEALPPAIFDAWPTSAASWPRWWARPRRCMTSSPTVQARRAGAPRAR